MIAKVFRNGRSQAIRLPEEFRVDTNEVYLKRTREGFLKSSSASGRNDLSPRHRYPDLHNSRL
jgi:hypothetical protein